jgi:hypothetical protein
MLIIVAPATSRGRHADQEVVRLLLCFDAVIKQAGHTLQGSLEGSLRASGDLIAHQDAELIDLLPGGIEAEEGADLEVRGRDVDALRELAPLSEIPLDLPVAVAVIDDE